MFRSRSWFGGGWGRPKNPHSLEYLKYLYNVLSKNQTVSEHNRGLLVESLRSIAEILIWGDQNDSSVFDFFLEKNMLSFFLRIMRQRSGGSSYVCVQLLQTLNILFENIRNETSLYYLLSNNHVNSIIVHKFDFSDEEVMAYYISFLKTLSLKLNPHTIHFFYNEHTNDFPLYTEAIKFFNHPESMVRIAVRTLTLNVYKVEDASMLAFIRDRTAAPYFSNIVWFIGKHIQELDACVRNDANHQSQNRLADLVAEHLDHLHYLNDILLLNITDLNQVLTDHLLHKLLIPLYIYSLTSLKRPTPHAMEAATRQLARVLNKPLNMVEPSTMPYDTSNGKISCVCALFLLSQVFLIISYTPLTRTLAWIILRTEKEVAERGIEAIFAAYGDFVQRLEHAQQQHDGEELSASTSDSREHLESVANNVTDEEKLASTPTDVGHVTHKPFLEAIYGALDCADNDYMALFALSLLYAVANNTGVAASLLETTLQPTLKVSSDKEEKYVYNTFLVDRILHIALLCCQPSCKVRLVTLELALKLLLHLVCIDGRNVMGDAHKTTLEMARTQSTALLRNFYKSEEIFLDMFEHEYCDMSKGPLNVEWLCMDSAILLPPTGTPMTGIDFTRRLPCGEVERARRAIRVFFLVREAALTLNGEQETQLPLTNPQSFVQIDTALDLNNSDLIGCTVAHKDGTKLRRFLVIDVMQLILVEPDTKRLGWGVAKLVGFLQDIEVTGDKDDSRSLHITIHRPLSNSSVSRVPLLSAKFIFDDNIRCMAANQRLTKGRVKARQKKMQHIARLLDIPGQAGPPSPAYASSSYCSRRHMHDHAPLRISRVPGFAAPRRDSLPGVLLKTDQETRRGTHQSRRPMGAHAQVEGTRRDTSSSRGRSREGSPKMPRPRSEEIPLEVIKKGEVTKGRVEERGQQQQQQCAAVRREVEEVGGACAAVAGTIAADSARETSFIADALSNSPRKRGNVETV